MSQAAGKPATGHGAHPHGHGRIGLFGLVVGAIGVVFGDIGTSPLYTIRQAFSPHYGLVANHDTVLGVLSMIFWSLTIVVTLKYVTIIMRADNDGEGGIMALMALAQRCFPKDSRTAYGVGILGILGAALFFGDGVITPAISVLSAVEGLEVVAPGLHHWIVPITVLVLVALFATQRFGTAKVGKVFGPITVLWFITLAVLGVMNILHEPEVLHAINPWWAARFFVEHSWGGIFILGAVVLAVTGGEAIYTDMGHFGARPIRYAWYFFVLPSLMLNYLGQGALVLEDPAAIRNPFYVGVPDWARWPMIVLATMATVIASQAVITGGYSIARQAMQLGYIPRMRIRHTSRDTIGQIYIPGINWTMMVIVIGLVLSFRTSSALAAAYGISVSATMLIDTLLLAIVARALWPNWRRWVLPLCALFLVIDGAFLVANGAKVLQGAWFPVVLGIVLFVLLRTWRRGRQILHEEVQKEGIRLDAFIPGLMLAPPVRVPGTAVFLTSDKGVVPHALMHNLKHNKVLHERVVLMTLLTEEVPRIADEEQIRVEDLGEGLFRVIARFGFMEDLDVPHVLDLCGPHGLVFNPMDTTFFLGRETLLCTKGEGMPLWRERVFVTMWRGAARAMDFLRIPPNRVVELGSQVEI